MLSHAQVHKDPLPQKTGAVRKINYDQSLYQKLIQMSWKTSSDFKSDVVNKHPFPISTTTHTREKEPGSKESVRKGFR